MCLYDYIGSSPIITELVDILPIYDWKPQQSFTASSTHPDCDPRDAQVASSNGWCSLTDTNPSDY